VGGVALAVAIAAGAAYATIPGGDGVIHGCYADPNGALRVVDTSTDRCGKHETAIAWNQRGPTGDTGPTGPTGPPGPAGTTGGIASIDDLEGVRCTGLRSKLGTIRVDYGAGLDAPVALTCQTHLVANPGPFTLRVSNARLTLPLVGTIDLPADGWHFGAQIDFEGHVSAGSIFQVTGISTDDTTPVAGFGAVRVTASLSVGGTGVTGTFDPELGTPRLEGGLYASVDLTVTADLLGVTTQLYAGRCTLGTPAAPLPIEITTDAPGVPYSQTDGSVTLTSAVAFPSLDECSPAVPGLYAFVVGLFAGPGRITVAGATNPILHAT
jgi:hypothetical protein